MSESNGMIIIGLGSGRSGTASLAHLLNAQPDAVCFHELNPACAHYRESEHAALATATEFAAILQGGPHDRLTVDFSRPMSVREFEKLKRMSRIRLIGDIAHYYLAYVEAIARGHDNVRFVCLKRDRGETVDSWMKKTAIRRWPSKALADRLAALITRAPFYRSSNHWTEHDGSRWRPDPVWDKCFPKFPGPTKREMIEQYWDYYYERADALAGALPDRFRIFETRSLNTPEGRAAILDHCGLGAASDRIIDISAHKHAIS